MLPIVIGLTTNHEVCCNTLLFITNLLIMRNNLINCSKIIKANNFLSRHKILVPKAPGTREVKVQY